MAHTVFASVKVTIHRAVDLEGVNLDGTSNPYIVAEIPKQPVPTFFKTKSVPKTCHPVFQPPGNTWTVERVALPFDMVFSAKNALSYEQGTVGQDELLGTVKVNIVNVGSAVERRLYSLGDGGDKFMKTLREGDIEPKNGAVELTYSVDEWVPKMALESPRSAGSTTPRSARKGHSQQHNKADHSPAEMQSKEYATCGSQTDGLRTNVLMLQPPQSKYDYRSSAPSRTMNALRNNFMPGGGGEGRGPMASKEVQTDESELEANAKHKKTPVEAPIGDDEPVAELVTKGSLVVGAKRTAISDTIVCPSAECAFPNILVLPTATFTSSDGSKIVNSPVTSPQYCARCGSFLYTEAGGDGMFEEMCRMRKYVAELEHRIAAADAQAELIRNTVVEGVPVRKSSGMESALARRLSRPLRTRAPSADEEGSLDGSTRAGSKSRKPLTARQLELLRRRNRKDLKERRREECLALYSDPGALLQAAEEGRPGIFDHLRMCDPLLSQGFDQVRDAKLRTPLHIAAGKGNLAVLDALLRPIGPSPASSKPPNLDLEQLVTNRGNTVLHTAAGSGHIATVEWLLKRPGVKTLLLVNNYEKNTPLQIAVKHGYKNIASLLARLEDAIHPGHEGSRKPAAIQDRPGSAAAAASSRGRHVDVAAHATASSLPSTSSYTSGRLSPRTASGVYLAPREQM